MNDATKGNDKPDTTGSDVRPARHMESPDFQFHLAEEFRTLKGEPAWSSSDRNARTLVHEEGLRVVVVALKAGAQMERHQTRGWVSILVHHGRVRIGLDNETLEASAGDSIVLRHNIPHTVEATEESGLLLTVTAPAD